MGQATLPPWAQNMREVFRAETISQFILYGNIHDLVPNQNEDRLDFLPLKQYLYEVLFDPFDVVLFYNRGKGISLAKGIEYFHQFLQVFDRFQGSSFASDAGIQKDPIRALESPGLLPRAPAQALELIDRFLGNVARVNLGGKKPGARSVAVVLDFANFIVPRGESLYIAGEIGSNLIKILNWAEDTAITAANIVTVLLTENLTDLNEFVVESAYNAKIQIPLPGKPELDQFLGHLVRNEADFGKMCEAPVPLLAEKLVGLSRINVKGLVLRALRNSTPITMKYLAAVKKEIIEKEAMGRLEFIESRRTLDDVAGQDEAKTWLREDARLMKRGTVRALPMGYLICGRIGTGKTWMVECFAGECGVPFVEMKNFREKWVGATEGNLEKIFNILHALGQVVVFVDEADQATGRRESGEGDSGLSGRIYGMLAKEMADTRNRGKILWIFATSRPDLVEVDLKRQGRLDVHIPLFPPHDAREKQDLFLAMARKLSLDLQLSDLPELSFEDPVSGNELEGLLVRAYREFELQPEDQPRQPLSAILAGVAKGFRPSAHTTQLELMDLLAVRECTDERFLPSRFKSMDRLELDRRIAELQTIIRLK